MIRYQILTAEKDGKTRLLHGLPITSKGIDYLEQLKLNQEDKPDYLWSIIIVDLDIDSVNDAVKALQEGKYKVCRFATVIKDHDFSFSRSSTL